MKPQPFNLDLWLLHGKPDCVWTRGNRKVLELKHHENANGIYKYSGLVKFSEDDRILLYIWSEDGRPFNDISVFSSDDLMLHLEDKSLTFGVKKK